MTRTTAIAILTLITAAIALPSSVLATEPKGPMAETVQVVRETGVRLYAYLNGWVDGANAERGDGYDENTTSIDWSQCTRIEPTDLASRIGGDGNPITDGWGRAVEVCVELDNLSSGRHIIGVRSAGADGKFGGPSYEIRPFDEANQPGSDIVWMDGYFMTWPQKPTS